MTVEPSPVRHAVRQTGLAVTAALLLVGALSAAPAAADVNESCAGSPTYNPLDTSAEASTNTRHVVTVDLNGDGAQDMVAANLEAASVTVLLGNGDGTFAEGSSYTVGTRPYQTVAADFDGDGSPDRPPPTSAAPG